MSRCMDCGAKGECYRGCGADPFELAEEIEELEDELQQYKDKLDIAKKALEFYEDENNFTIAGESGEFFWVQNDYREASEKARQALSKIK